MVTEERINELAYSMWEQDGRPEGKDQEHYNNARYILEELEAAQASTTSATPRATTRKQNTGGIAKKSQTKAGATASKPTRRRSTA